MAPPISNAPRAEAVPYELLPTSMQVVEVGGVGRLVDTDRCSVAAT